MDTTDPRASKKMKTKNGEKRVGPGLRSHKELMKFLLAVSQVCVRSHDE